MKIVSACLAGLNTRYDGKSKPKAKVIRMVMKGEAIAVCPEQLGGLPTPRPPAEIRGGDGASVLGKKAKVFNCNGENVTKEFIRGANETLKIAKECGAKEAIFAARSPSCGCGKIYDGSFSGKLIDGDGVATALLKRNGIKVISGDDI
jgi:uncharacterized protein YbbK (DUF523 family)